MDVTGGVLGGCCQVTVIALLSSSATATTLEGHEGTPTSERNEKQEFVYYNIINCQCFQFKIKCITIPLITVIFPSLGLLTGVTSGSLHWKWYPLILELAVTSSLATVSPTCTVG